MSQAADGERRRGVGPHGEGGVAGGRHGDRGVEERSLATSGEPGGAAGDEPSGATSRGATAGEPVGWGVRRVVVAVDASPGSAAAARQAARLAARLSAELCGLFVEDAALVRLATLPVCIEVGTWSATPRPLGAGDVERRLRAQASRARRLVESSALAAAVADVRFDVLRGEVRQALAEAVTHGDLLSLGRVGTTGLARLGGFARAALAGGHGQLLLLPASGLVEPPFVAVFGESPGSRRALAAALRLVDHAASGGPRPGSLTVLLVAADDDTAGRLEAEARAAVAAAGYSPALPRFRRARPGDRHALAHTVALDRAHLLLLPAESPLVRPEDVEEVVAALDCSVLVVR